MPTIRVTSNPVDPAVLEPTPAPAPNPIRRPRRDPAAELPIAAPAVLGGDGGSSTRTFRRLPASSPAVARATAPLRIVQFDPARFDRAKFYDGVRAGPFPGRLSPTQVQGMDTILDEWSARGMTDLRWLAYMLATTFHETAQSMQPIEEFGKGRGKAYGRRDQETGQAYYGRGFVQLTWRSNYEKMGALLGIDLVHHPELALRTDHATRIMFEGMTRGLSKRGDFTGKSLETYFTAEKSDWKNARRIINGTDKAELIAGYGRQFYQDLIAAQA